MPRLPLSVVAFFLLLAPWRLGVAVEPSHDFARWEPEVAALEAQDRASPPPKGALLFIGSSTIRLWTSLAADFPQHPVINRGFGGTEIADVTHFASRLIFPHEPKAVYFRSGTNDIHNGKTPAQVFDDFREFVAVVRARLPATKIYFISLCPTIARWPEADANRQLNTLVRIYTENTSGVCYIETWSMSLGDDGQPRPEFFLEDKLHFNAEGYKLLAALVRPHLLAIAR